MNEDTILADILDLLNSEDLELIKLGIGLFFSTNYYSKLLDPQYKWEGKYICNGIRYYIEPRKQDFIRESFRIYEDMGVNNYSKLEVYACRANIKECISYIILK